MEEVVKGKDSERVPEARFEVLISSSEERSSACREKTSALMTTEERGSGHSPAKNRTEAGKRGRGREKTCS